MYRRLFKPALDYFFALVLLVLLFPLFILISLMLLITNRGSVFYTQYRPGINEKIFNVIKFKTMTDRKDSNGILLPDEYRMTKVGTILRKFSLDELPQLLNVINGKMSFVGPRPLLVEYLPLFNEIQRRRHSVRPGITGWAQVNGRNAISWEKKFEYDIWYVQNISFILDIKIILMTVKKVLKSEDINSKKSITMEKFTGNE